MNAPSNTPLAVLVLAVHLAVVVFNIFGLIVIPLGGWRGWRFVGEPCWRILHLAALGAVALQAALGRPCFLTLWQEALTGAPSKGPMIMRLVNSLLYWPLPPWVFEAVYVATFTYALALMWLAPVRWRRRPSKAGRLPKGGLDRL